MADTKPNASAKAEKHNNESYALALRLSAKVQQKKAALRAAAEFDWNHRGICPNVGHKQ